MENEVKLTSSQTKKQSLISERNMLRFFFWTLFIINVLIISLKLAFDYGYLESYTHKNNDPYRMKAQVNTDKLNLMTLDQAMDVVENNQKKLSMTACVEVGKFTQEESKALEAILKPLNLGERQTVIDVSEPFKNMVYITGLANQAAVDRKIAQLKKSGLNDVHFIEDKAMPAWSISLGVFKTPEAAKLHLATVQKQGFKEAKIAPRPASLNKYAYRFKELVVEEKKIIDSLKDKIANYQTRSCAAQ